MNSEKFAAIRHFYAQHRDDIRAAGRNEWGINPYAWDESGLIRLTPIEQWLWSDIRWHDLVLYPQFPVGPYFVDFGNPIARVAIECDGLAFHQDSEKDAKRQRKIEEMGWDVIRFSGAQCRQEADQETGKRSEASARIKLIGEAYRISRATR